MPKYVFNTFYMSSEAITIARVTGTISSVSSAVIMYIIIRSASRLSTSYHRIMFFTSFWDLLTSAAIALTTIPMPKDVIYDFDSVSYGNVTSCSVQGFIAYIGSILGIFSICILCIYYLCALKYKCEDRTIRTYVEPVLFISSTALAFFPGIALWRSQHINPQPYEPFCTIGSYPFKCMQQNDGQCIRGKEESFTEKLGGSLARYYLFSVILFGVLTVSISMAMIVSSVRASERALAKAKAARRIERGTAHTNTTRRTKSLRKSQDVRLSSSNDGNVASAEGNRRRSSLFSTALQGAFTTHSRTKIITVQALMYVAAFSLTWIFSILTWAMRSSVTIAVLKMIFQPLQGFFNALIFVHHKVHDLRQASPDLGICEAIGDVFLHPGCVPEVVIYRIELVGLQTSVYRDFGMLSSDEFAVLDSRRETLRERAHENVSEIPRSDDEDHVSSRQLSLNNDCNNDATEKRQFYTSSAKLLNRSSDLSGQVLSRGNRELIELPGFNDEALDTNHSLSIEEGEHAMCDTSFNTDFGDLDISRCSVAASEDAPEPERAYRCYKNIQRE